MQKAISKSGQPYSPVEEYFYSVFLVSLALLLVARLLLVLFERVMPLPPNGDALYYAHVLLKCTTIVVGICFFAYVIIRKMWLILAALSIHFLFIVMTASAFEVAVNITHDFSTVDFFNKFLFWAQIGLALAFLISDKNQYGWYLYIGLSMACATILQLLMHPLEFGMLYLLMGVFVVAQDVFLLLHVWYYRQKKMPFWFLFR